MASIASNCYMHGKYGNDWWAKIAHEISELSNADGRLPGDPLTSMANATVEWHVHGVSDYGIWKSHIAFLVI